MRAHRMGVVRYFSFSTPSRGSHYVSSRGERGLPAPPARRSSRGDGAALWLTSKISTFASGALIGRRFDTGADARDWLLGDGLLCASAKPGNATTAAATRSDASFSFASSYKNYSS